MPRTQKVASRRQHADPLHHRGRGEALWWIGIGLWAATLLAVFITAATWQA